MKRKYSKLKKNVALKSDSESGDVVSLILRDHKPIKDLILILKNPEVSIAKKKPVFAEFERMLASHSKAEQESLFEIGEMYSRLLNKFRNENGKPKKYVGKDEMRAEHA